MPGRGDKRQAILSGARDVFAREGYTRASVDGIARAAGVSTRTIYNHFADKEALFLTLIQDSAAQVRTAQLGDIERHLGKVGHRPTDLAGDLVALARAFAVPRPEFAAHFALVRQIHAEVGHIPPEVLAGWQDSGPRPVHAALAARFADLIERGELAAVADPPRVASHFMLLTATDVVQRSFWNALPIGDDEVTEIITTGVAAFLRAYRPWSR